MLCSKCQRPMLLLFISAVCDHCDGAPKGDYYRGYVVWREGRGAMPVLDYVWRTAHDAAIWRSLCDQEECEIRCVLAPEPIEWRVGQGKAAGLTMATRLFEIYADHRFPPLPDRAFFAPPGVHPYTEKAHLAA